MDDNAQFATILIFNVLKALVYKFGGPEKVIELTAEEFDAVRYGKLEAATTEQHMRLHYTEYH